MYTIKENVECNYIVDKSEFIGILIKIKDVNLVKEEIDKIKDKYKDATHYCYAYIIDDFKKSSDDGEPGGTAGVPIMDTLNKQDLNYVLCVVVRYFGGIKLGAGGLIRAYRKAVTLALQESKFVKLENGYELTIEVSYDKQKEIEYILKDNYQKEYKENVIYSIECTKEIKEQLENKYEIKSIKEKVIEI